MNASQHSLASIDALILKTQSDIEGLKKQRVDVYLQTRFSLSENTEAQWAGLTICGTGEPGKAQICDSGEYDTHIEQLSPAELSEMWHNHLDRFRGNLRCSRGIYCDGHTEDAASRLWVFVFKSGEWLGLNASVDNRQPDGMVHFKRLMEHYLEDVATAYQITVEDGMS